MGYGARGKWRNVHSIKKEVVLMNKDTNKGKVKQVKINIKENTGKITDD
jgi:hypothetical protein